MRTLGCRALSALVSCGAEDPGSINATVPQVLFASTACRDEGYGSTGIFLELMTSVLSQQ